MGHIVLLGDSIFDNGAYVGDGPEVASHLRDLLGPGWQVTLLAIDGSMVADIAVQLEHLPADATHLVVSAGGNDALDHVSIVEQPVQSVGEALGRLAALRAAFEGPHRVMLAGVRQRQLPTAACTIYEGNFEQSLGGLLTAALAVFNDAITRNAFGLGLDLIDLRLVCTEGADYANPIEPSAQGGGKIARALARFAQAEAQLPPTSRVFR